MSLLQELQEALTISATGIAAVFLALTTIVLLLFLLNRLLTPKINPDPYEEEPTDTEENYAETSKTEPKESSVRDLNGVSQKNLLTPEDKELEEVAIIAAIAASMGVFFVKPQVAIETPISPPQTIHLWRLLGRQQFFQSQGVTPRAWKR